MAVVSGALQIGDRVGYTTRFLRSIGAWEFEIAERRGTVVEVRDERVVRVLWDGEDEPASVLQKNVAVPGSARFALD